MISLILLNYSNFVLKNQLNLLNLNLISILLNFQEISIVLLFYYNLNLAFSNILKNSDLKSLFQNYYQKDLIQSQIRKNIIFYKKFTKFLYFVIFDKEFKCLFVRFNVIKADGFSKRSIFFLF